MNKAPFEKPLFKQLRAELKEIRQLAHLMNLAVWDQQVNLPIKGAEERGEQLAMLAKLRHKRMTADKLFDLAHNLNESSGLSQEQTIVVREVLDDLVRARTKPMALIAALAEKEAQSYAAWLQAREQKKFAITLPHLKDFLALKKEYAQATAPDLSTYDALLDDFERGARSKEILERFAVLRTGVLALRDRFLKDRTPRPATALALTVRADEQRNFFADVGERSGFDMSRGRIDPTIHPFMSEMGTHDVRLTTQFGGADFFFGFFAFLHEMGHGLYEQGMRQEWAATPLAEACSLAIHESQSLLYEKQLGLSFGYQEFLLARLQQFFPTQTIDLTPERLFKDFNRLSISLSRLANDELGYSLHIILRTELEDQLLSGSLALEDLPEAWGQKTERYFGRKPADDREGVLQDVHWYSGLWGYFPHYLGGGMYASQLMETFRKQVPSDLSGEKFQKNLLEWLREHVHHKGRSMGAEELITEATGSPMDPQIFLSYLEKKYEALESLK